MKAAANKRLPEVLEILQAGRFESAFRTAKEVVASLKISRELRGKSESGKAEKLKQESGNPESGNLENDKAAWDAGGWKSDLDDEILQKILPRLHGSRTRVGPLLGALGWYLHSGDKAGAMKFFPVPGEELPEKPVQDLIALGKPTAAFPRSFAKVQRHGPRGDRRTIRELHLLIENVKFR